MQTKKVLMIVNEFPPTGESGVQRPLKFLKYLDRMNWNTYVITPKNPTKSVQDITLMKDVPINSKVFYTKSWGVSSVSTDNIAKLRTKFQNKAKRTKWKWRISKTVNDLLFPIDKQIGWVPFALVKSIQIINHERIGNVYITAYPYSAFLVGLLLKLLYGKRINWIADYRDAWQFEPMMDTNVIQIRKLIISSCDRLVLKIADRIVFTSTYVRALYIKHYPWLELKSIAITNGFDEDDFKELVPHDFEKYTLLYMGKIYHNKGNPLPILECIAELDLKDVQYIHIGTIAQEIMDEIQNRGYDFFVYEGYKDHLEALNYSSGADINVLVLNDDEESKGVIPGKIFELLRIGKPILAVGPRGSYIQELIANNSCGSYSCLSDKNEIKSNLLNMMKFKNKCSIDPTTVSSFSRYELTKLLASQFNK